MIDDEAKFVAAVKARKSLIATQMIQQYQPENYARAVGQCQGLEMALEILAQVKKERDLE